MIEDIPKPTKKLNIYPANIPVTANISYPCRAMALSTNKSTKLLDIPRMVIPMNKSLKPVKPWMKLSMSIIKTTMNYSHWIPVAIERIKKN